MNVLAAFSCPYCGGTLLRESYYVRCGSEHRFTARFAPPPVEGAMDAPGGDGPAPPRGSVFQLRVVAHPDRGELGRVHVFPLDGS